jgi:hypothetical protein
MPVEIRELNIKINLTDSGSGANADASGGGDANEAQEKLIETVVEKVLEILKEKEER